MSALKVAGRMPACLSCNICTIHVLPHSPPPALPPCPGPQTPPVRRAWYSNTLHSLAGSLCFLTLSVHSLCSFSFLLTLFSVHLSHYGLAISSGVENEVLISLLINLPSPEVPESLPASQNDDWHFYLFGEISVGAKLNFNGSRIPPVKGAIHY